MAQIVNTPGGRMSIFERVVMKTTNYFVEAAEGDMREARRLYLEWVGEVDDQVSEGGRDSWIALVIALDVMLPCSP